MPVGPQGAIATAVGLIQTTRVPTALLMGFSVALPVAVVGQDRRAALLAAVPFLLGALGGFALNDYYDVEKDRINNPHRAIPTGRLTPRTVLIVALVFLAAALIEAAYRSGGRSELALYLAFILGMWCYNGLVGRFALLKTGYTGAVSSILVWYDVIVLRRAAIYYLFPFAVLAFIVGRELLMDIRDVPGDRTAGTTVPMVFGERLTASIAFFLQFLGALLLLPVATTVSWPHNAVLLLLAGAVIGGATTMWWAAAGRCRRAVIYVLWIPMLIGVMMLVV